MGREGSAKREETRSSLKTLEGLKHMAKVFFFSLSNLLNTGNEWKRRQRTGLERLFKAEELPVSLNSTKRRGQHLGSPPMQNLRVV